MDNENNRFFIYDLPCGISNLIKWLPTIWRDRNSDEYFIFVILRKKLANVEHFLRYEGHSINANKDADEIRFCLLLLDRYFKDEYFDNAIGPYEKKWGKNFWYIDKRRYNSNELQTKDFMKAADKEEYMINQDIEYLFSFMSKHIRSWWD